MTFQRPAISVAPVAYVVLNVPAMTRTNRIVKIGDRRASCRSYTGGDELEDNGAAAHGQALAGIVAVPIADEDFLVARRGLQSNRRRERRAARDQDNGGESEESELHLDCPMRPSA